MLDPAMRLLLEARVAVTVITPYGRHMQFEAMAAPREGEQMTIRNYPPKRHHDPGDTEYAKMTVTKVTWERNPEADFPGTPRMAVTVRLDEIDTPT